MDDVVTVAWACALDFTPTKLMVVLDKIMRNLLRTLRRESCCAESIIMICDEQLMVTGE